MFYWPWSEVQTNWRVLQFAPDFHRDAGVVLAAVAQDAAVAESARAHSYYSSKQVPKTR